MSNLTTFKSAGLPAVKDMASALKANLPKVADNGGSVIIKMDKTGHWVFGADQTEIQEGSQWAINPFSFVHGFIAWGDGDVLGEKMVGISQPLPELEEAPKGAKRGWEAQVGMAIKCLNGDDKGMEAKYTVTSVGGKRAVQELGIAIANHIEEDPSTPVAVVSLSKDHYTHKSYGRIYTPVFNIIEWISMDGEAPELLEESKVEVKAEAPAKVEAEAVEQPARRRRAAV